MKQIIYILSIVAISVAEQSPEQQNPKEAIAILKYDNDGVNADGSYQWSFETANGISAQEEGQFKKSETEEGGNQEVSGSFQYTASDGTPIKLTYIANENGFQPEGDHLPTPPSIPPAIQKALEWIASQAPAALENEAPAQ